MPTALVASLRTQAWLLVPQPVLAVAYVALVRVEWLAPEFWPMLSFAIYPLASVIAAMRVIVRGAAGRSGWRIALLVVAALELVLTVIGLAIIGFAIAARSG